MKRRVLPGVHRWLLLAIGFAARSQPSLALRRSAPRWPAPARLAGARAARLLMVGTRMPASDHQPGVRFLRIEPDGIRTLARRLPGGCLVVSATNGKTTSAGMVAEMLRRGGARPAHNVTGANLPGGIATALLAVARRGGRMAADVGVFEVDELTLPALAPALAPRAMLLGNLFRDQLDRTGEVEAIAASWAALAPGEGATRLVLCADDPIVAELGRGRSDTLYFGIEDRSAALPGVEHAAEARHCRRCGARHRYTATFLAQLGHYRCPACGSERPSPEVAVDDVELHGLRGSSIRLRTPAGSAEVRLSLPGLYNVYNAAGAAALGLAAGIALEHVVGALGAARPVWGRAERLEADGRSLTLMLVKNPAGANAVLRTLEQEPGELDLLGLLNDGAHDARDVSWIWDAEFEPLAARLRSATCGGTRGADLAVRLKYAGVQPGRIAVETGSLGAALELALERAERPLFVLATYSAMLELRPLVLGGSFPRRG